MKSITSRLQEISDIGAVEEDGTTFSNVAIALNSVGIAAVDSSGQLRSLQDILTDLGPMWESLDRNHQAYLATILAGNRQQSRFISLMDNYDRAMELVEVSQNASGESARQLRAYNDGLEASMTRLSNAWQQLATSITSSETISKIIDLFTKLIETIDKIPDSILQTITYVTMLSKGFQVITNLQKVLGNSPIFGGDWGVKSTVDTLFPGVLSSVDQLTSGVKTRMTDLSTSVQTNLASAGTAVKESVQQAFSGFTSGAMTAQKSLSETSGAVQNYNMSLSQSKIAQDLQNSTFMQSAQQAELYEQETTKLAAAIEANAEALGVQLRALNADDKAFQKQIDDTIALTQQIMGDNRAVMERQSAKAIQLNETANYFANDKNRSAFIKSSMADVKKQWKTAETGQLSLFDDETGIRSYIEAGKSFEEFSEDYQKRLGDTWDNMAASYAAQAKTALQTRTAMNRYHVAIEDAQAVIQDSTATEQQRLEATATLLKNQQALNVAYEEGDLEKAQKIVAGEVVMPSQSEKQGTQANQANANAANTGKQANVLMTAFSSVAVGSIANIAAAAVTGSEEVGDFSGRLAGLTSFITRTFPSLGGLAGLGVAAGLTVLWTAFDAMYTSVEDLEDELDSLYEEYDSLSEDKTSASSALSTYEELSKKINRTEDEQEELNSAASTLAELVPSAVKGYDSLGNAIINVTAAQEELNAMTEQQIELLSQQVDIQTKINTKENSASGLLGFLSSFGTWITGVLAGEGLSGDYVVQQTLDAIEEQNAEIAETMQTYMSTALTQYASEVDDDYANLVTTIGTQYSSEFLTQLLNSKSTTAGTEIKKMYDDLMNSVIDIDWSRIDSALNQSVLSANASASYSEIRDSFEARVTSILEKAGLDETYIPVIIDILLGAEVEGYSEVNNFVSNLEDAIEEETDSDRKKAMEEFLADIKEMDLETAAIAESLNLLDMDLIDVINSYGGLSKLVEDLTDPETGEITSGQGYVVLQDLYDVQKELEEEKETIEATIEEIESEVGDMDLENPETNQAIIEKLWKNIFGEEISYNQLKTQIKDLGDGKLLDGKYLSFGDEEQQELYEAFIEEYNNYITTREKYIDTYQEEKENLEDVEDKLSAVEDQMTAIRTAITAFDPQSFGDLSDTLSDILDSLETMGDWLVDLDESGGVLSGEGLVSLFSMLENFQTMVDNNELSLESWASALTAVADGVSMVNGEMIVSQDAQEALNQLTQEAARLKIEEALVNVQTAKANYENQRTMLQASIAVLEAEKERISQIDEDEYDSYVKNLDMTSSLTSFMADANIAMVKSTASTLNDSLSLYAEYYSRIKELSQSGDPLGLYSTFGELSASGGTLANSFVAAIEEEASRLKGLFGDTKEDTLANIEAELESMYDALKAFDQAIEAEEVKEKLFSSLLDADDLFDSLGVSTSAAAESTSEYNEQLERTLTLLEKIEGLQHKIDENDTFRDLYEDYDGTRRGELLAENLRLYQEQYQVYLELFEMQQEMVNQAAGDLLDSIYGELFTISENGDIGWASDEMYYKYKGMTDDMQEEIDELVEKFQEQRDALRDTETELTNYASAIKDAREEILDLIEETEDLILETLMNREEVLHNARVAALEAEIEMIEEAVEARQKAREDEDDASDLYEAQEALRRASLDSSGKNNATLLQLQQDLEDKQKEISEKRFEEDMDNRIEYLQAIIDAENETYDYRLETMTWYWEQVELMMEQSTETIMDFLMTWNEEYLQESQTGQMVLMQQWQATFDELNAIMTDEMTSNIEELKSMFLDVASSVEAIDIQVQALAGSWQSVYETASKAMSVTGSSGSTSTSTSGGSSSALKYYTSYTGSSGQYINSDALTNGAIDESKVWTSVTDNYGNYYMPNNVNGSKVSKTGVTAGQLGITYNSSGVNVASQAVWKSAAGEYYIWNGTAGKYETVKSLFANYGNNGFGSLANDIYGNVAYTTYSGSTTVPTTAQIKQALKALGASTYAQGGIVDYTGPAWVDGSTSKPEAFLSAYQTEQIGALASALDTSGVSSVSESSNVSFGTISFNVASMSSTEDGKKALDAFVKGANEMMAKKGINTTLNLNYK